MNLTLFNRSHTRLWLTTLACTVWVSTAWISAAAQPASQNISQQQKQQVLWAAAGKVIFFSHDLSTNRSVSCATCHQAETKFTDGLAKAVGVDSQVGSRNTPSLIDAAENKTLFWDGRRASVAALVVDPFTNPIEHGLKNEADLLMKARSSKAISDALRAAKQPAKNKRLNEFDVDDIRTALTAFIQSLIAKDTPFDRYQYRGDKTALNVQAIRGLAVFRETGCATCHTIGETKALFTDHEFHSLGINRDAMESKLPLLVTKLANIKNMGGVDREVIANADFAELGRFLVTRDPKDIGKFRTPSLLNVSLTAPYMHDGSVATLSEAVERELYYRGLQSGKPIASSADDRAALMAYLQSLNEIE
jgi:cytochrome c peroxidase